MRTRLWICLPLLLASMLAAAAGQMRCGDNLVERGLTFFEVQERCGAVFFRHVHVVEAFVWFGQSWKLARGFPIEATAVNQYAADGNAMSAQEFRG